MKGLAVCLVVIVLTVCYISINASPNSCKDCLILTPHIKHGNASLARKLSEVRSNDYFGIRSHSGFITVNEKYNSNLFFWFFPAMSEPMSKTPWIIWLEGGPGFSSLMGLFELNGPLNVVSGKVTPRNVTWASDYSVLYVDNPVGAGFSFTDDDRGYLDNEDDELLTTITTFISPQVGAQLLEFLHQFLDMFPELRRVPLFVTGESYAGKYVPALAIQIHRRKEPLHTINLRGIAIGNGLIHPASTAHYSELCSALGLLAGAQVDHVKELEAQFLSFLNDKRMIEAAHKFNETVEYIKKHTGVSIYNFNEDPTSRAPEYEAYVTRRDVMTAIHAGNASFHHNNQLVYEKMLSDIANTTKPFVEELLEHYGVMSYIGQLDVILGYSLARYMYAELTWSRRNEYEDAPRKRLRRFGNGSVVAYKKNGGNFVDVVVRRAGHMVTKDQPEVAKFIMDRFIEDFM